MNPLSPVLEALEALKEDPVTTRKVKEKAGQLILLFQQAPLNPETLGRVLHGLEGFDSAELPAYDRTQLWDLISLLESLALTVSAKP